MKRAMLKLTFAVALSATAFATAQAAPGCKPVKNPICPAIYDPVTCSNGKTYSNQCFANADCATGCVSGSTI